MSTTNNWAEANQHGTIQLHRTGRWALVRLDGPPGVELGWYLFGPGADGMRVDPDDGSPALNLLLASCGADSYVTEFERRK